MPTQGAWIGEAAESWLLPSRHKFNFWKGKMMTTSTQKTAVNPLTRPSEVALDLSPAAVEQISDALRPLLADVFSLYLKTKNFHWHMTGRHFRDYHLLLDEHADQVFAMTDDIAERARKIGGLTLRSISDISQNQRLRDNNAVEVTPRQMMQELLDDNLQLTRFLRATHGICDRYGDVATASLIENWIDQTERRAWFLSEIVSDLQ
jgi:starvation-inducible DNA-binding protein